MRTVGGLTPKGCGYEEQENTWAAEDSRGHARRPLPQTYSELQVFGEGDAGQSGVYGVNGLQAGHTSGG